MATYLFKWDRNSFSDEKFDEHYAAYERSEPLSWSCGNTKRIQPGDKAFLLRTGNGGGLIGSGVILEEPVEAPHFNASRAAVGERALYAKIQFDYLTRRGSSIPILRDELNAAEFQPFNWDQQGGGKEIRPEEIVSALQTLWNARVGMDEFRSADEVYPGERYVEGAVKAIEVNAYERNLEARRKCRKTLNQSATESGGTSLKVRRLRIVIRNRYKTTTYHIYARYHDIWYRAGLC